jgi:hypothetical protein
MTYGQLGNVPPNGEDYRPHEVEKMIRKLWVDFVAGNPGLFKTAG